MESVVVLNLKGPETIVLFIARLQTRIGRFTLGKVGNPGRQEDRVGNPANSEHG